MAARQYSNPRLQATVEDWPSGSHRVTTRFLVETHPTRGQRGLRQTRHPKTGAWSTPKKLTYARHVRIVDGDDGKTYLAELDAYGNITIMQGDMKFQAEYAHRNDTERHAALSALFE